MFEEYLEETKYIDYGNPSIRIVADELKRSNGVG
jgi:hypothetical protein